MYTPPVVAMASFRFRSSFTSIILLILLFITQTLSYTLDNDTTLLIPFPDDPLEFTKITTKYGYLTEEHSVITKDGYILVLFRIVHGKNCHERKRQPPVLLMHGLLQTSDAWIDAGPNTGFAYLISDACFDLWLGNVRGNAYSRKHVTLDPDKDTRFWNFTVDEIGLYDVPAIVDYILNYTEEKKLNYIGFSQGAGTFFIMCSEKPKYCDKINVMIALAPSTRHVNSKSFPYRAAYITLAIMAKIFGDYGVKEVFRRDTPIQQLLANLCQLPVVVKMCELGLSDLTDLSHPGSITKKTLSRVLSHYPAGSSLKNLVGYGQSSWNTDWMKFDYGREENLKIYGTVTPPKYNLNAVTAPVVIIYALNDGLVDVKDVKWLVGKLPNVVDLLEVKDPLWNHLDMNFSKYVKKLIFPKILEHLLANSY